MKSARTSRSRVMNELQGEQRDVQIRIVIHAIAQKWLLASYWSATVARTRRCGAEDVAIGEFERVVVNLLTITNYTTYMYMYTQYRVFTTVNLVLNLFSYFHIQVHAF